MFFITSDIATLLASGLSSWPLLALGEHHGGRVSDRIGRLI
ncbi:hypothetical protein ACG01O_10375 [Roseateles sp. BYS87W]|uniref:Uncharacterized protein n=1 Tax=Pelomonas baiyunensis TaxID=3299026 RepID=A0ABW7GYH1_9BURK